MYLLWFEREGKERNLNKPTPVDTLLNLDARSIQSRNYTRAKDNHATHEAHYNNQVSEMAYFSLAPSGNRYLISSGEKKVACSEQVALQR